MGYKSRKINHSVQAALHRGKSILLLGPRQTGKTTYILEEIRPNLVYTFADPEIRQRYEKNPLLLTQELKLITNENSTSLIFIDEVQKIPSIMDSVQLIIDQKKAQFILSGSSAHKLKYGASVNLLPGRVVLFTMDPLHYDEIPDARLNDLLIYGSLPGIVNESDFANKEIDLKSYVQSYLEEEIRAEAMVRNVGKFSRFLELAAIESGNMINFTKISHEIGVATSTIIDYFQILEDCMIVSRIEPVTETPTRRRLQKSPKYIFFDMGVRRMCANEGSTLSTKALSRIFEQYIGISLLHQTRAIPHAKLKYWRDNNTGVEVDYILEIAHRYIPIEVKWSANPSAKDTRHLQKFLDEYPQSGPGYIICQTPRAYAINERIMALPWNQLDKILSECRVE